MPKRMGNFEIIVVLILFVGMGVYFFLSRMKASPAEHMLNYHTAIEVIKKEVMITGMQLDEHMYDAGYTPELTNIVELLNANLFIKGELGVITEECAPNENSGKISVSGLSNEYLTINKFRAIQPVVVKMCGYLSGTSQLDYIKNSVSVRLPGAFKKIEY